MGRFYLMIPKIWRYCMLEWAGATFVKLTKIQAWQELVFVLSASSKIESREKASKLSFWWSDDTLWKICFVVCIILAYAIDVLCFIELLITLLSVFGYFLVCSVINAVIINTVKHQKVTKTLNNVIAGSMQHKMSVALCQNLHPTKHIISWIVIRLSKL